MVTVLKWLFENDFQQCTQSEGKQAQRKITNLWKRNQSTFLPAIYTDTDSSSKISTKQQLHKISI